MVGAGRFERPTPCAQGRCATRLRYAPTLRDSESTSWLFRTDSESTESAHAKPNCSSTHTLSILALSATFVSERRYLQNVSPKTLEWYKCSFKAFDPFISTASNQNELRLAVKKAVMEMSEAGKLSHTSINDYARCINAFLKRLTGEGHILERITIPKIKIPEKVPALLSTQQVTALIQYKLRNRIERRVHTMALVVLDTGVRVDEGFHCELRRPEFGTVEVHADHGQQSVQRTSVPG